MRASTSQPGAVERFSAANGRVKPWGQFNLSGRPYVVLRIEAAGDVRMQRRTNKQILLIFPIILGFDFADPQNIVQGKDGAVVKLH